MFIFNDCFCTVLQALDSFLLVFTQQGVILYASESVTSLLGHLPVSYLCMLYIRIVYSKSVTCEFFKPNWQYTKTSSIMPIF